MSAGPEQRLNPEERANLVAYIDGELTDHESRAIATKLTQSATARQEVDALKKYLDKQGKLLLELDPPDKVDSPQLTNLIALGEPDRSRSALTDLVDRIHRGAIYVLAVTIPTVVNGNVFNQHTPCAAPKNLWSKHNSGCPLTAQFAFDVRSSFSSPHASNTSLA